MNHPAVHGWVFGQNVKIVEEFQSNVTREPLIPVGAPLDHAPK
jgi:hypothetical protein